MSSSATSGGPTRFDPLDRRATIRSRAAALVWLLAVLAAAVLAVGALFTALRADRHNALVAFVQDAARVVDGPFGDLFDFGGKSARTKEALVNWGLAAVVYLVVGKVVDRLLRP